MKKVTFFFLSLMLLAVTALAQDTPNDVTKIKVITKENNKRVVKQKTLYNATQEEIDTTIEELKGGADANVISIDVDRKITGDGERMEDVVIRIPEINIDLEDIREDLSDLSIEIGNEVEEALREVGESLEEINGNRNYSIYINRDQDDTAFLGIESYVSKGIKGVLITKVHRNSAAEKAGLQIGDIIKKLDGKEVYSFEELAKMLSKKQPEESVEIAYSRDGRINIQSVVLGSRSSKSYHIKNSSDDSKLGITVRRARQGIEISNIANDSRAEKMGLQSGDIIKKIHGKSVHSISHLRSLIDNDQPLEIEVLRTGKTKIIRE